MALVTKLTDLATRVATECKSLRTLINGNAVDLSSLSTTAKTNLVSAINELYTAVNGIDEGASINDSSSTSSTETWSIQKIASEIASAKSSLIDGAGTAFDTLNELADALNNDSNFAATINTALGNRARFDAAQTLTAGQKTQICANIGVGEPETDFVTTFNTGLS